MQTGNALMTETEMDRIVRALRGEVYSVASHDEEFVFAVADKHDKTDVEEIVWRALSGADADYNIEERGSHNANTTRWAVTT